MNVGLRCLDVVVEIISESLNVADDFFSSLLRQMARKEN